MTTIRNITTTTTNNTQKRKWNIEIICFIDFAIKFVYQAILRFIQEKGQQTVILSDMNYK